METAGLGGAIRAVLFDLGGVVFDSPVSAIHAFERRRNIPQNAINYAFAKSRAWRALEKGQIGVSAFCDRIAREGNSPPGIGRDDFYEIMQSLGTLSAPRTAMVTAIKAIRKAGLITGAITNNWAGVNSRTQSSFKALRYELFDTIVESSIEGIRKPNPKIFLLACSRLGVRPEQCVFLDDLGYNLKPAKKLGMRTIRVRTSDAGGLAALERLEKLLGLPLLKPRSSL